MQTIKDQSTPLIFRERWAVAVGKETFYLNKTQIAVLKKAMISGNRGAVWFEKFAISIPHVQSIHLVEKVPINILPPETEEKMTPGERKKALKKLDEVRKKLTEKMVLTKKQNNYKMKL